MQIILTEEDLNLAVTNHITTLGMNLTGKAVNVTFTAGRGVNGNTATVDINQLAPPVDTDVPTAKAVEPVEETPTEDEPDGQISLFDDE